MNNGKRRIQRALVALTLGAVAAVVPASAAFAGEWQDSVTSRCSTAISSKAGGGLGTAHIHYNAYRSSTRKYVINWADSWVDGFWVCNGDYQVTPYKTQITVEFRFDGSNLSCSGGFSVSYPGGVGISYSCTVSGQTVVVEYTTTCTWAASCQIDMGYTEILANSGATFFNYVNARTRVSITSTSGTTLPWNTHYV